MTLKRPRRWTAATNSPTLESPCLELTCAVDGLTHQVDESAYAAGSDDHRGRYRAVCGRFVLPASMVVGPGHRCPNCTADG